MPDTRFENRVRQSLRSQAEAPFITVDPGKVAVRARRRLLRNSVGLAAAAMLVAAGGIWSVPRIGRSVPATPVPIVLPGDGKIAFTHGTGLYVVDPDGIGPVRIAQGCLGATCKIGSVAWSPSGTEVVFAHYSEKSAYMGYQDGPLYLSAPDGSDLRALTNCHWPSCWDGYAAWSPDGSKVAFIRYGTDTSAGVVYVIDSDGSNLVRLSSPGVFPQPPAWSPDSSRIAFLADDESGTGIMLVTPDGSMSSVLVNGSRGSSLGSVAWSPAGGRLAYVSFDPSTSRVEAWVISAEGGEPHLLLRSTSVQGPIWSPTGSRLAVVVDEETLIVMNPDGTGQVHLASGRIDSPVWSPSGTKLAAFLGNRLVVISADGSGQRNVTGIDDGGMIAWQSVAG